MAHGSLVQGEPQIPLISHGRTPARPASATARSSWRYPSCRRSRTLVAAGMALSAAIHGVVFFGFSRHQPAAPPRTEENLIALTISLPNLKDLEDEPEPSPNDSDVAPVDLSIPVPMQADLPALARPNDFVQALDFSSLLERPDMKDAKISVIPDHIRRGVDLREKIGSIFNIGDLDRPPEPIVQPAPVFPFNLKREAIQGRVRVEFVVDTEGRVHNPFVVESSHPGFEEAALTGVSRWKFRAGIKAGRKVNTRMQVPILFKIIDEAD